jgi:hypothetical protein
MIKLRKQFRLEKHNLISLVDCLSAIITMRPCVRGKMAIQDESALDINNKATFGLHWNKISKNFTLTSK